MAMTYEEVEAQLTAPGAPFEVSIEPVRGIPMKSFKHRERSLREKIANVALHGEADCMVQGERRISYGEFARLVWGAARALRKDFGLQHGDRLAVLAYNSPEWLIALFGATSLGGIGVGINGWWKSEEIHYGMSDSGSRYLAVDERLHPRVEAIRRDLPDLETVFFIGDDAPAGTVPIEALLDPRDEVPDEPIDEDDPFVILYTMELIQRAGIDVWGARPCCTGVVHSEKIKDYDLSSLRAVSFGEAPTPPETLEKARELA
jgi:acyl-CoA synthetase (AMP-forming)/AMP-acid ligase II